MSGRVPEAQDGIDWEAVETEYRSGIYTLRELAVRHNVSHVKIHRRAKDLGWEQDLTYKVKTLVGSKLVKQSVTGKGDSVTAAQAVELAAQAEVSTRLEHRSDIRQARVMVKTLLLQLEEAIDSREDLEDQIELLPDESFADRQKKAALVKAISISSHAAIMDKLTGSLQKLVALERQAFGMDEKTQEEKKSEDPEVEAKRKAIREELFKLLSDNAKPINKPIIIDQTSPLSGDK